MLKGIAGMPGSQSPVTVDEDEVVALPQAPTADLRTKEDDQLEAVAQMGAALLHVDSVLVFAKGQDGELAFAGGCGVGRLESSIEQVKKIASQALLDEQVKQYTLPRAGARERPLNNRATAVCAPVVSGGIAAGVVVAVSRLGATFSTSDIDILSVVAGRAGSVLGARPGSGQAAVSSGHDHIIQLAHTKIKYLSLVNQVSEALSSTLELDELLRISLEQSTAAIGAQTGSLMLINEETGSLEIVASLGLASMVVDTTKQAVGSSIAGWVAQHGESALVGNARRDKRFEMNFFRDEISSSASVPLRVKGEVIGVLNVSTTEFGRVFDKRDLELLETVANQMASAIDNARLYQKVQRRTAQLDSLLQITRTITQTLNLDEVLQRLSSAICQVLHLKASCVLMVDDLTERFRFGCGSGFKVKRGHAYMDAALPVAQKVKRTRKRVLVRDVSRSRSFRTEISDIESLRGVIGLPVCNQRNMVAVFVGFSGGCLSLTQSQRDIITQLAELGGVAIHNARVYRQKYRIAKMLQNRLIPCQAPTVEGLDIGHAFLPAREVGGDYYDFLRRDTGELGIVVGDVAGSDVEAAEYTTMGKHILRAYARREKSPARVLCQTNDHICEDVQAEVFISMFYGTIDVENKTLRYANGGCEPAMLYRADSGEAEFLTASGILLGITMSQPFEDRKTHLRSGDLLVVFTDGYTEACSGDERLGTDSLPGLLRECARSDAQSIADRIKDHLLEFVSGNIGDDCAIVVVKIL